jgi:hypothetical protein
LTHDGWRISELPLYGVEGSYFDTLTDRSNTMTLGTTGFCGFYLWRNYEKALRPTYHRRYSYCHRHYIGEYAHHALYRCAR